MKEQLSRYYQKLPDRVKKLISPLILLRKFIREYKFDVYLIKGKSEGFYVTPFAPVPYFVKRIFSDAVMTKTGEIYIWQLRKFINSHDTVMLDIHKTQTCLLKKGFFLPYFVRQVVDLDTPIEEILEKNDKRNGRYELKRTRKFSYVISTDLNDLKMFYETMYVPYAKKRFGDLAILYSFDELKDIFTKGELLFITLNGKHVAGTLNEIGSQVYFSRLFGVLHEDYIKAGVLAAGYYYSFRRAKEINAKVVDFGTSRPFFSDGVLNYKLKLGTRIVEDKSRDRRIYLKRFPKEPIICFINKRLQAILSAPDNRLINMCRRAGLEFQIIENT